MEVVDQHPLSEHGGKPRGGAAVFENIILFAVGRIADEIGLWRIGHCVVQRRETVRSGVRQFVQLKPTHIVALVGRIAQRPIAIVAILGIVHDVVEVGSLLGFSCAVKVGQTECVPHLVTKHTDAFQFRAGHYRMPRSIAPGLLSGGVSLITLHQFAPHKVAVEVQTSGHQRVFGEVRPRVVLIARFEGVVFAGAGVEQHREGYASPHHESGEVGTTFLCEVDGLPIEFADVDVLAHCAVGAIVSARTRNAHFPHHFEVRGKTAVALRPIVVAHTAFGTWTEGVVVGIKKAVDAGGGGGCLKSHIAELHHNNRNDRSSQTRQDTS